MRNFVCILAFAAVVGLVHWNGEIAQNQVLEYQTDDTEFAVVVVQDGISGSQAQKMARQRAAEITVQNGYRYFTIDSEQATEITQPDPNWANTQAFPTNLYQEKIVEKDFGKQSIQNQAGPDINTYPAFRLTFTVHKTKPLGRSVDACTLTDCQ